jgi:hypothetical protein
MLTQPTSVAYLLDQGEYDFLSERLMGVKNVLMF